MPGNQPILLKVLPLPREDFPVSAKLIDDRTGNAVGDGDGKVEPGEAIDVELSFENGGGFDLCTLHATLRILQSVDGIELAVPSAIIDPLAKGEKSTVRFTVNVDPDCQPGVARVESTISAADGRVFSKMPIDIPIYARDGSSAKSDTPAEKPH
jgi:hypothetical protein